jgi:alpha-L-fucosidase 2
MSSRGSESHSCLFPRSAARETKAYAAIQPALPPKVVDRKLSLTPALLLWSIIISAPLPVRALSSSAPPASLNLKLQAPIRTWDEALPLGNGLLGALVWGETNTLRVSLDRGDLWDERPSKAFLQVQDRFNWRSMQQMVAENRMDEFNKVFDSNYEYDAPPTKLPAGRLEFTFDPDCSLESFELDLASAEADASLGKGREIRSFVNAADVQHPVVFLLIRGAEIKDLQLRSPESVKKLAYVPARPGGGGTLRWFEQLAANGFSYVVCVGWKRVGDSTLVAATVATSQDAAKRKPGRHSSEAESEVLSIARELVESALARGYEKEFSAHKRWWTGFWNRSNVQLPEPHILQQYYLVRYFYGAASRRGAPPMPLQGVWSADAGSLPPWKGDYHNDLNTQMTYLAYRTSGDFDEGASFLDFLWNLLPVFRKFAKDFYDAPGAAVPGVMSLAGQPLGGWGQYSLSPTMGAWNAHLFYLHWRHTGDATFLRKRAYPFCTEIGICLRALLKPDVNGLLKLPLSSSPEIFDNTRRAFLKPNSNYDLACVKMLFLALSEMAVATGHKTASAEWSSLARQLGEFHTAPDGVLLLDEAARLPGSHRHLSNLMPLHPFNLITVEGTDRDLNTIQASIRDWEKAGTSAWCGYSFSWMACLRARIGDAEAACLNLDIYTRAFVLRNGFHANGDQTKSGFSTFTYRPFTLEGNFLAMEAVHEMLLQSWSAKPGSNGPGVIRIFPAVPWRWHEASFEDLRAEGGHKISARRQNNAITWLRVEAGSSGLMRIRDNFAGSVPTWNRKGVTRKDNCYEVSLRRGQILEATFPARSNPPSPPPDEAKPVKINSN